MRDTTANTSNIQHSTPGSYSVRPTARDRTILDGERALDELPSATKQEIWDRFMLVAAALEAIRTEAMFLAGVNAPDGHDARYKRHHADLIKQHRFDRISKQDRSQLIECLTNRGNIENWLSTLPFNKRLKLNHPLVILRNWKAATQVPTKPKAPSAFAKLQAAHAEVQERLNRAEHEIARGGGDLWSAEDRPQDIARVIMDKVSKAKAKQIAAELNRLVRNDGGAS